MGTFCFQVVERGAAWGSSTSHAGLHSLGLQSGYHAAQFCTLFPLSLLHPLTLSFEVDNDSEQYGRHAVAGVAVGKVVWWLQRSFRMEGLSALGTVAVANCALTNSAVAYHSSGLASAVVCGLTIGANICAFFALCVDTITHAVSGTYITHAVSMTHGGGLGLICPGTYKYHSSGAHIQSNPSEDYQGVCC